MRILARFNANDWMVEPRVRLATHKAGYMGEQLYTLDVKSHPFGALKYKMECVFGNVPSITIRPVVDDCLECQYAEISHFLSCWSVEMADTKHIKLPFVSKSFGLGDAFAAVAERAPLWFKMKFNGCIARRMWWNMLLQFDPRLTKQEMLGED